MISSLQESLESTFRDVEFSVIEENRISVLAPGESIPLVLRHLEESGLDHLALVSCVDRIEQGKLEVIYLLTSYLRTDTDYGPEQRLHVLLKARIPREAPRLKSAIGVFANAEPYERELHELYGVHFEGHPRLIPLFLERDYDVPPFRKDFDTRAYVEEKFGSIPPVGD